MLVNFMNFVDRQNLRDKYLFQFNNIDTKNNAHGGDYTIFIVDLDQTIAKSL